MGLLDGLLDTAKSMHPLELGDFRKNVPAQWIERALQATGTATVRKRRLPAEQVVWLVIGMALYRNQCIEDVVSRLDLVLDPGRGPLARSAVPQARAKLGDEPLEWLFETTSQKWATESADKHRWRGLAVYGIDGTTLRVSDTDENTEHFGKSNNNHNPSGYPLVRVVTLMVLRSHLLAGASFGPYTESELRYAERVVQRVSDHSLVIVDRLFLYAAFLLDIEAGGTNRHWLTRTKSTTQYTIVEQLAPGDAIVELVVSDKSRRKDPSHPRVMRARAINYQRPGCAPQVLLTSLMDARKYPAAEIIELYHERWQIELGYGEIKTDMLCREECIRSKKPKLVRQEVWGILLAYNGVRLEMDRLARARHFEPTRLSFVLSMHMIQAAWLVCSSASPGAIPRHLARLRSDLRRLNLPPRRPERAYPRAVKIAMNHFPRKRSKREEPAKHA
jgi:hypothetical protein